jgi:FkbM family methyltransferase
MPFPNAKRILKMGSPLSSLKLLLTVSISSRPKFRALSLTLLRPFVHDGEFSIKFRCYERFYKTFLRMSDLSADFLSTRELCVNDIYHLDRTFAPDLVIDGGGNIGLFTLRAAAALPIKKTLTTLIVCEPLPRNIKQIQKHLDVNRVQAEILPYCLGGTRRTIPFYCRGANESSFNSDEPYDSVIDIPVVLLNDAIGSSPAERILIKLDIEGMEVEALEGFVPNERRSVYLVGELHEHPVNHPILERLFLDHGWTFEFFDIGAETSSFRACSPPAVASLAWAMSKQAVTRSSVLSPVA